MTIKGAYSANIRAEMGRRGWSGRATAEAAGIKQATWTRRMRNNDWRVAELALIARALRVQLSALTGED